MKNKNVLIGITGGIAAYKILNLISILRKNNNNVKVILTENALNFVTKLSLQTISGNKVYVSSFNYDYEMPHISLTDFADMFIIAPATANIIGKFNSGIADDLLTTTFLSFTKDIIICPAMNTNMYNNKIVQKNINDLKNRYDNIRFIEPATGKLACGVTGIGRLPEPIDIYNRISDLYNSDKSDNKLSDIFKNKKVLITAGPTKEYIDPVRFISNDSSGLQGFYLANSFSDYGAKVTVVSGKSEYKNILNNDIRVINADTTEQMFKSVKTEFKKSDIFVSVAAVADFKPVKSYKNKLKKKEYMSLKLKKNIDILEWCGKHKKKNQMIIGFAAETENLKKNAFKKLESKNCDFIIANLVKDSISKPANKIKIIDKSGEIVDVPQMNKKEVSEKILNHILNYKC